MLWLGTGTHLSHGPSIESLHSCREQELVPCVGGGKIVRGALEEDFECDTRIADLPEEPISRYVTGRAVGICDSGCVCDLVSGKRPIVVSYGVDGGRT